MTDRMRSSSRSTLFRPSIFCIALAAALQAGSAWAVEPFVLKDIRVEGLQRSDAGTVFASLPFRIGETYTDEKGAAALRALFATGLCQGRAHRHRRCGRSGHRRRATCHRQHRLRRPEGVRQGSARQVAEGLRHRRRPALRQGRWPIGPNRNSSAST